MRYRPTQSGYWELGLGFYFTESREVKIYQVYVWIDLGKGPMNEQGRRYNNV